MTMIDTTPSRRSVLAGLGGMAFCIAVGNDGVRLMSQAQANAVANAPINPWVRIAPDGKITILTAGAEMGQGSMTSLPLIVAEEMDADWGKVAIEWTPADAKVYGYKDPFGTEQLMWIVGSRAVQLYFNQLRMAGAQVRKVLIATAAQKWGVDAATLKTEPSVVINPANGQRLSYGEIAAFGTIPATLPAVDTKELKDRKQFRLIGKSVPRRDTPFKVNGSAQYAIDVKLPGMVYASTLHSPVHNAQAGVWDPGKQEQTGAAPESWNDAEVKAMQGVIGIIALPNGLAVVADHFENAKAGRDALKVNWKNAKAAGFNSGQALEDYVRIHADPNAQTAKLEEKGDVKGAFASATKAYHAEFRSDYGYHAQMEPLNAVVRVSDAGDKAEVWEGSQAPDESRKAVAKALGLKDEQVEFHQCYMGGGFGRRSIGDYAAECARIAKQVRRPVKLIWTREEDIAQGMFRPQSFQCLEAATDASGKVTGWKHCVVGDGAVEISLDTASGKIRVHKVWLAVDGGLVVQPAAAKANVESAIIYGLSSVLHERITIKDGAVEQSNFHDYNVMRMSDLPDEMTVQFVDVDTRPTGLGEIGNPFIGGAVSNAFYRLTGKRLRHLPFTPERVLETLKT